MSKTITVNGKRYTVPDEATMDQVAELVASQQKPLHGPELAAQRDAEALVARRAEQAKPKPAPAAPAAPPRTLADDVTSVANATGRALAPYGTAAAAGAAAGSFGGPVGTATGAALAPALLAVGDTGAAAYNAFAPMFGGSQITGPSDFIRQGYDSIGLSHPVAEDDQMGRVVYNMANTAGSAIGVGGMVNSLGKAAAESGVPVLNAFGRFFSAPVSNASQIGGALAGGAATEGMKEVGVPAPIADVISIAPAMLGGHLGDRAAAGFKPTPKVNAPSAAELGAKVKGAYDEGNAQGVEFVPDTLKFIVAKAMKDAIDPKHPDGPMPLSAIAPSIRDELLKMTDAATEYGRMDGRDLDFWRQELGKQIAILPAGGPQQTVAIRIREGLDNMTSNPDYTLNAVRGDVAAARAAHNEVKAVADARAARAKLTETDLENATAAWKADPSPENAAVRTKAIAEHADAVRAAETSGKTADFVASQYESRQRTLHAQDPDIKAEVAAHEAAVERETGLSAAVENAHDAYAAKAAEHTTLEQAAAKAKASRDRAHEKADARNAKPNDIARTRADGTYARAQAEADAAGKAVEGLAQKRDKLQAQSDKAKLARVEAANKLRTREQELSPADDAAARVEARNAALEKGRDLSPTQKRAAAMERVPKDAGTSATGASGDTARALRAEVRAMIDREGPKGMARLPPATQRALEHFAAGGRISSRLMESIGRLSPGGSLRGTGNAFTTGLGTLTALVGGGNVPAGLLTSAISATGTTAARVAANAMAKKDFARVRDLVAQGSDAKERIGNAANKILNYMLTSGITTDPGR